MGGGQQQIKSRSTSTILFKLEKSVTKLQKENNLRKYHLRSTVSNHWYSIHYMLEWFQEQQKTVHCSNAKDKKGSTACRPDFPSLGPNISGTTSLAQMSQSLEKRTFCQGLLRPTAPQLSCRPSVASTGLVHGKYLRGIITCISQSILRLPSLSLSHAHFNISGQQKPFLCGGSLHSTFKSLPFQVRAR